jgi:hypothetical protein
MPVFEQKKRRENWPVLMNLLFSNEHFILGLSRRRSGLGGDIIKADTGMGRRQTVPTVVE